MSIEVKENVRHNGKQYYPGEVITDIKEKEAKRLVSLGVAFFIEQKQIDIDYAKLLDKTFNYATLKETAIAEGLKVAGNISNANLIKLIIEKGKAEDVLAYAKGDE